MHSADLFEAQPQQEKPVHETLTGYLQRVQQAIKAAFNDPTWLVADIANIKIQPNGNVYIDLVDTVEGEETAKCRATAFGTTSKRILQKWADAIGGKPEAGMRVLLKARAEAKPKFGLTLDVVDLDPAYTVGEYAIKMAKIVEALKEKGFYGLQKALPAPKSFWRVAVVAPSDSAGLADFRHDADILSEEGVCKFEYFTATFQGPTTAESIQSALKAAYDKHQEQPYDVLCIIRGGGAKSDLAWLNDLRLAAWVCRLPIPVYVGIGHEVDQGVLDLIAHRSFGTPSKVIGSIRGMLIDEAAKARGVIDKAISHLQRVVDNERKKIAQLDTAFIRVATGLVSKERVRAANLQAQIVRGLEGQASRARREVESVDRQIVMGMTKMVAKGRAELELVTQIFDKVNPMNVLKRGFMVAADAKGNQIKSAEQAGAVDGFRVHFSDGSVEVKRVKPRASKKDSVQA